MTGTHHREKLDHISERGGRKARKKYSRARRTLSPIRNKTFEIRNPSVQTISTFFYARPRYFFMGGRGPSPHQQCYPRYPRFIPFGPQFPLCRVLGATCPNLIPSISSCSDRFRAHSNRNRESNIENHAKHTPQLADTALLSNRAVQRRRAEMRRRSKLRTRGSHFKADMAAVSI